MNDYTTIEFKKKYKDLNDTLFWLCRQAKESIDYCSFRWGSNNTIDTIWTIGKQNLIYKNDKKGIEQIQSVGTLMENNIHSIQGAGDCDCFTVFTIAMLLANNYKKENIYIYLQGRNKKSPSHVLTMFTKNNKNIYIDFTEPHLNMKRSYKYFDIVPISLYL